MNGTDASAALATPEQIIDDLWAPRATQVLVTAIELDLFGCIAAGQHSVSGIATAAGADPRGVRHVLDALVALGYLDKTGAASSQPRYVLTQVSARFLVPGTDSYLGDMARETRLLWSSWARLTDVVRTGEPTAAWEQESVGREQFPQLVSAWFPMSFGAARAAVAALPPTTRESARRLLDVAAGSGAWSLAFALALPELRVTTVDYSEVCAITRSYAERFGVADRYDHVTGNLREVDFGTGYDIVVLGYIVHTEGPEWGRKLIERAYAALRPGGTLVIGDMVPNDERTDPIVPLVFGATDLLLYSTEGQVFTEREFREWLTGAGFTAVETLDILAPSPLIVATR